MKWSRRLSWLGYLLWAVFVNVCNEWMIRPLLLDYAVLGLVAVVAIVLVWLLSIPKQYRRRWIGFTIFSLILGSGAGSALNQPSLRSGAIVVVMTLGLMVLAYFMTKVRWAHLLTGAVIIILANIWLPITLWPFLTHFRVTYQTSLPLQPGDFPTVPLEVVNTASGQEVVTLKKVKESPTNLDKLALSATNSSNALENVLRNYNHRYALVALSQNGGRLQLHSLSPQAARTVDPLSLVTTFFPAIRAYWAAEHNQVIQYMVPAASPRVMSEVGVAPGNLPVNLIDMGQQTEKREAADWQSMLQPYGGPQSTAPFTVQNGRLTGVWNGQNIAIPVTGGRVIGTGSFTGPNLHQVLVEGPNFLEVVSLDHQSVVSIYHGNVWNPLSNDIVTGPINSSGQDVVFVDSSPAQILQPTTTSNWKLLYTAPNPSLRFEASIQYPGHGAPEIITDDPSYMRDTPTRYFTSYTYRNGQLVRNWRVYETNIVNVHPVQFQKSGPTEIVAAIYGTGHILVLKRHWLPLLPASVVILGLVVLGGYVMRISGKRRGVR
ncbi:hypothetical protein [Alicyclobacillus mengziensis]|uniref:Uncharacterized protein n=1 Tax=Alicyclobacillus mengziensis TaxID=2931921 RepID=A0A9X7W3B1_9BACL|nr:hypothetical protein [Alicyclobacillus mengziensis]QSO49545.1 hypothetical protein JZ786_11990 [Alicyclobacillus mengziensis]